MTVVSGIAVSTSGAENQRGKKENLFSIQGIADGVKFT